MQTWPQLPPGIPAIYPNASSGSGGYGSGNAPSAAPGGFMAKMGARAMWWGELLLFYSSVRMVESGVRAWTQAQMDLSDQISIFTANVDGSAASVTAFTGEVNRISQATGIRPNEIAPGVTTERRVPDAPPNIAMYGAMVQRITGMDNLEAQKKLMGMKVQFPDLTTVQILDTFAGALKKSTLEAGQFFGMIDTAGPLAVQFNTSISEMLGMFAGLSTATGESGQSLELFMRQMDKVYTQASTRQAVEKYIGPVLSIDPKTGDEVRRDMYDIFDKMSKLPKPAIQEIANTIPNVLGQQTRSLFFAMLAGWDNVKAATDSATNSTGVFADMMDERMKSAKASLEGLQAAWDRFLRSTGGGEGLGGVFKAATLILEAVTPESKQPATREGQDRTVGTSQNIGDFIMSFLFPGKMAGAGFAELSKLIGPNATAQGQRWQAGQAMLWSPQNLERWATGQQPTPTTESRMTPEQWRIRNMGGDIGAQHRASVAQGEYAYWDPRTGPRYGSTGYNWATTGRQVPQQTEMPGQQSTIGRGISTRAVSAEYDKALRSGYQGHQTSVPPECQYAL